MEINKTEYRLIKGTADLDELGNYRLCFDRNGTVRDIENLVWLHHKNLVKQNEIYYAMYGEQIAAIYTALPVLFRIEGKLEPALQSIDTLTDVEHRGKGLFIKLANKLYDEASANHYALVYGFPNENSAPGFFSKLKWESFGEAPFLIRPLNLFYFFKKLLNRRKHTDFSSTNHIFSAPVSLNFGDSEIKTLDQFEQDYDALWTSAATTIKVSVDRSAHYMNWRYIEKPGEHYYRYGLFSNGELKAVIVFSIKGKHDGRIGYIMELIHEPDDPKSGKVLLDFCSRQCKNQKVDAILAWCLPHSFNFNAFSGSGYFRLPEKLRPQKLYIGARALGAISSQVHDLNNWYISYSDSDTA